MALGVGLLTVIVASSFRYGFLLSGKKGAGLATIVVTSLTHLAILAALTAIPPGTHAAQLDMPANQIQANASLFSSALVPLGGLVLAFILIPIAVGYCIARVFGGRANVA
jgi:hypothetical protein